MIQVKKRWLNGLRKITVTYNPKNNFIKIESVKGITYRKVYANTTDIKLSVVLGRFNIKICDEDGKVLNRYHVKYNGNVEQRHL